MSYWGARSSARYESEWPAYVPVAERRRKAELAAEQLSKQGHKVAPVKIEGRTIASTFWGKAWCTNLESYRDFEYRLERGRSYVRNGSVVDLQIAPREVTAMVSGSDLYEVKVSIGEVKKPHWKAICTDCMGGIDSLVELLQGRFSKGVMERICLQGTGLFPAPAEIRFTCSCPDWASMCKHVAAVLYGIGARLDKQPELLFRLRAVNEQDLIADIGNTVPLTKQAPAAGKVLETDDVAALFGLDMGGTDEPPPASGSGPETGASRTKAKPPGQAKQAAAGRKQAAAETKQAATGRKQTRAGPKQAAVEAQQTSAGRKHAAAGRKQAATGPKQEAGAKRAAPSATMPPPQRTKPAARPKAAAAKLATPPAEEVKTRKRPRKG